MTATTRTPVIPDCRTQDTICQWADVQDGDLAVYHGHLEQVDGILPQPGHPGRLMALIAGHWVCVHREDWTAVRRYITGGDR